MQRNQAEFCVVTPKGIFIVDAKNFHVKMLYSPVVQVETRAVAAVLKKKKKLSNISHILSFFFFFVIQHHFKNNNIIIN